MSKASHKLMSGALPTTPMMMGMSPPTTRPVKSVRVRRGALPYRLVACDMDGTLLTSDHNISDRTRRVMAQLLARGVHVVFATGRPFTDVFRIKRRLTIFAHSESIPTPGVQVMSPVKASPGTMLHTDDNGHYDDAPASPNSEPVVPRCFAVTSNGACVYDEMNTLVREECIDPRVCKELYGMFTDDPEVNINIFRGVDEKQRKVAGYINLSDTTDDQAREEWVSRYPSNVEAALYHQSQFMYKVVPDLETTFPTDNVNEIFFLCYNLEKAKVVEEAIVQRIRQFREQYGGGDGVRVAPSAPYCIDIIPEHTSKASALQYVVGELGLSLSDCIAFGDGLNDVEMLSAVGKGCIMANANPRLNAKLPDLEVIGKNDDDAVARKLIEVFGLEDVDVAT